MRIAYRVFKTGVHRAQISPRNRDKKLWVTGVKDENGLDIIIRQIDAESYLTEEFYTCWYVYCMTENLGSLPFAGGWAEQPCWISEALSILKVEESQMEQEKYKEDEEL